MTIKFSGKACSAVWAGGGAGPPAQGTTERVDTAGGDAVMLTLKPEMQGDKQDRR